MTENLDKHVVAGFGDEWSRFDQSELSERTNFDRCLKIISTFSRGKNCLKMPRGFDLGCGSGRWAKLVAPARRRITFDRSELGLEVAKRNLEQSPTIVIFHQASVEEIPLEDDSLRFRLFSLGVLHHIPDTEAGLRSCVRKLKNRCAFFALFILPFRQSSDMVSDDLEGN